MPSATSPATWHITGLTAASWIGMSRMLDRPRIEQRHHEVDVVVRPLTSSGVPFCQQSQTARTALTYSRIHGPAGDQGRPKRRSICALTCVPSPSVKRPRDSFCRVQALMAVTVGLRGKAMATEVASFSLAVACGGERHDDEGSSLVSSTTMPS